MRIWVAAGELPPVDERLPANPFVRQVVDEIGVYGGTMRMWADGARNAYFNLYGLNFNNDMGGYGFDNPLDLVQYVEDGFFFTGHEPHHAESFAYNDDFTELTVSLREGLKWSDGSPFTADDVVWSWENIAINPNVWAAPGHWATVEGGEYIRAELIDETTVKFTSPVPAPRMHTRALILRRRRVAGLHGAGPPRLLRHQLGGFQRLPLPRQQQRWEPLGRAR